MTRPTEADRKKAVQVLLEIGYDSDKHPWMTEVIMNALAEQREELSKPDLVAVLAYESGMEAQKEIDARIAEDAGLPPRHPLQKYIAKTIRGQK